jgi:hypothetical protein
MEGEECAIIFDSKDLGALRLEGMPRVPCAIAAAVWKFVRVSGFSAEGGKIWELF